MDRVSIYIDTDGNDKKERYRIYYAVVEFITRGGDTVTREVYGTAEATANKAALAAMAAALSKLIRPCIVTVYLDNAYISAAVRQGRARQWRQNGWKSHNGEEIANRQEWEELLRAMKGHRLEFARAPSANGWREYMRYKIGKLKEEEWEQMVLETDEDGGKRNEA
ncbi:MAG: hypothetical protein LUE96_07380 [Lachnospiraceae bacterium]|nr:hypothetical protein [Lachnospiraceae bacterium]